jgi:hypothetical protein
MRNSPKKKDLQISFLHHRHINFYFLPYSTINIHIRKRERAVKPESFLIKIRMIATSQRGRKKLIKNETKTIKNLNQNAFLYFFEKL